MSLRHTNANEYTHRHSDGRSFCNLILKNCKLRGHMLSEGMFILHQMAKYITRPSELAIQTYIAAINATSDYPTTGLSARKDHGTNGEKIVQYTK